MEAVDVSFVTSVYGPGQLPRDGLPEIAFAGRSNVGKSSLLNTLFNRKNLVKVSGKPGKTQALNFFLVNESSYYVDLPGYGYAKVSKRLQADWGKLITSYLEGREQLVCVVIVMDIRHGLKPDDNKLVRWLRDRQISCIAAYTKADKLSGNQIFKQVGLLDSGHGLTEEQRVVFSSVDRRGREDLLAKIDKIVTSKPKTQQKHNTHK